MRYFLSQIVSYTNYLIIIDHAIWLLFEVTKQLEVSQ